MYWYVYISESPKLILALLIFAGLVGGVFTYCINQMCLRLIPRRLYRTGTALILASALIFVLIFLASMKLFAAKNCILMQLKDNELTGRVVTKGDSKRRWLFNDTVFMELKSEMKSSQNVKTADDKDIELLISAVVAAKDPNKVFYIWRDSPEKPGSREQANTNILNLILEQYMEVISQATLEDLEKDRIRPEDFFEANKNIKSILSKNCLELLDMKLMLRLPDKVLGKIKSTIVIAETKPVN